MKRTLILILSVVLTFALAIPSFAAWQYPGFMTKQMTSGVQDYTANDYKSLQVKKATPVVDGILDEAYLSSASFSFSNWSVYSGHDGATVHEPDCSGTVYLLWDDGYLYTCAVINDGDVGSIGLEAMKESAYPLPAGNPWMNDVFEQFLTRSDGSASFKVTVDAYCQLPFFSDWAFYSAFIDDVKKDPAVLEKMNQDAIDNGGWWAGDCIGAMWWVSGDVHPHWAGQASVADYIDWVPGEETKTSGGTTGYKATSRESSFATTIQKDGYIVESCIRMPEAKSGFDLMYSVQVVDIDVNDSNFLATCTAGDTQLDSAFHLILTGGTNSGNQGNNNNGNNDNKTPTGGDNKTPSGGDNKTPSDNNNQGNTGTDTDNTGKPNNPSTGDNVLAIVGVSAIVVIAAVACFIFTKKRK